jgi:hypothetical protein
MMVDFTSDELDSNRDWAMTGSPERLTGEEMGAVWASILSQSEVSWLSVALMPILVLRNPSIPMTSWLIWLT